jgi:hypothetical protein
MASPAVSPTADTKTLNQPVRVAHAIREATLPNRCQVLTLKLVYANVVRNRPSELFG